MSTRPASFIRLGLVALAGLTTVSAGIPGVAASAAPATADIRVIGGDANGKIVCGNVAVAQDLARRRGIPLQKSNCTATGNAGGATLQNMDIYVSAAARARNGRNPVLSLLADGLVPGVANDKCENHRPKPGPGKQLNKCWALGRGGRLKLNNVQLVNHQDGGRTTRTITNAVLAAPGQDGSARAVCANRVNHPLNQQDDCAASGAGASWSMRGVDVVVHNPDGSTTTRSRITVEVRGGNGTAEIFCFNVTDGSGKVVQINLCDANAKGGDATLRNVTIHSLA